MKLQYTVDEQISIKLQYTVQVG